MKSLSWVRKGLHFNTTSRSRCLIGLNFTQFLRRHILSHDFIEFTLICSFNLTNYFTELQLVFFLQSSNYSNEQAKIAIDKFFTIRTLWKDFSSAVNPKDPNVELALKVSWVFFFVHSIFQQFLKFILEENNECLKLERMLIIGFLQV